jgi:death-on-curing protein
VNYLSAEQVLFIHARLIKETGGEHGVRDLDMLLSAIGRPQAGFDNQDLYPDLFSKAAALMESLIRNHPFVDGNKRTGVTAAGLFLRRNGYILTASNAELVAVTMRIAQSQSSVKALTTWLRENSQPIEQTSDPA